MGEEREGEKRSAGKVANLVPGGYVVRDVRLAGGLVVNRQAVNVDVDIWEEV